MYLFTSLHLISLFIGFIVLQIYKMSRQEAKNIAENLTKIEKRIKNNTVPNQIRKYYYPQIRNL